MIVSLCCGDSLYYFEYLDHMCTDKFPHDLEKKPPILWCCGKIIKETNNYIVVVSSGIRDRNPSAELTYEIVLKRAIIKNLLVYKVESPLKKKNKNVSLDKK